MAPKKIASGGIDRDLLTQIATATNTGSFVYTSATAHQPMIAHNPPLVEVNTSMVDAADATKFATRATPAAAQFLAAAPATGAAETEAPKYTLITGAVLPEAKKRGNPFGGGAPTKYPFADMAVGAMFFSGNSEHAKGDALKALGSTVSSQNRKNAVPVIENGVEKTKTMKRAKRDETTKKAVLDANGKKIMETVTLPVLNYTKKFTIRPVTGGQKYGEWTAPENGVLIGRTV